MSGLNHASHGMDDGEIGFDKNGNQINDNGGMTTDYLYDENGEIIASTPVAFRRITTEGFSRGYGYYGYKLASGGINEDNTIFGFYAGGKITGAGLSLIGETITNSSKIGGFIIKNVGYLNKGNWWRLGEGTGKGSGMIRLSFGTHKNYINQVPKVLHPLNQFLRNNIGKNGHIDFPNWKW